MSFLRNSTIIILGMLLQTDKSVAIAVALRFFGQHHYDVFLKDAILDVDVWPVTVICRKNR